MVDLMAEATSYNILACVGVAFAVSVLCFYRHEGGTVCKTSLAGARKTALALLLLALCFNYHRINQLKLLFAVINYNHSFETAYLYGGKSYAVGVGKSLLHIVDKPCEIFVERGYLARFLSDYFIIVFNNSE